MALKLAIADVIGVKVEGTLTDESGAAKPFRFVLRVDRLPHDEVKKALDDKNESVQAFFAQHARGWQDQQLVLDEDGKPASFSQEALAVLLTIAGMANTCWTAYLSQVVVAAKN